MAKKLTAKQLRFIEAYQGNATEAARLAGYTGNDNVLGVTGFQLLRDPKISQLIKERESKAISSLIATREDRQKFWTKYMNDPELDIRYRLRASELLGRSQADFTEIIRHEGLETLTDEQLQKRLAELEKK